MATHSVASAASSAGRATSTEQAPHSPSAQPSLHPVSPRSRNQSSAVVCVGTPSSEALCPLTVIPGATITSSCPPSTGRPLPRRIDSGVGMVGGVSGRLVIHAEQRAGLVRLYKPEHIFGRVFPHSAPTSQTSCRLSGAWRFTSL